jgi:hypothetical protein
MGSTVQDVPIKDMDITVRAKNVLTVLGIRTKGELYVCFLLGTIPKIGTVVKHYPYIDVELIYSNKVNEEVKSILREEYGVEEIELQTLGL